MKGIVSVISLPLFANVFATTNLHAQKSWGFTITNSSSLSREAELIALKRKDIEKRLSSVSYVNVSVNGKSLVVQHDDINGDGKWDEAVFLYSFRPDEKTNFTISNTKNQNINAVQRAHVRLRKKDADDSWGSNLKKEVMPLKNPATDFAKHPLPLYLTEGPAWENDKVGFRLYFDVRNGKDIWGKRTSRMVLDSVGTKAEPSYHELHDWGMDILKVGKSLGAGALALLVPQRNGPDSLIRLGGENVTNTVYEQLTDGPVRARFRISYDWLIEGKTVQLVEETSIWGGQYFYESKITINNAPAGAKLVTGIVSLYENTFRFFDEGKTTVLLSHGKQSENKDELGMAIMANKENLSFVGSAPLANSDVMNSYLVAQNISPNKPITFRFYAAWEKTDSHFGSLSYFQKYLKAEAQKLQTPLQVRW